MNIVVFGSREFRNVGLLKTILSSRVSASDTIVSGAARGADSLAIMYARQNNLGLRTFPADWERYGKSAGFRRNEVMAKVASAGIAFWDYKSRGTAHMIDALLAKGKTVTIVSTVTGQVEVKTGVGACPVCLEKSCECPDYIDD